MKSVHAIDYPFFLNRPSSLPPRYATFCALGGVNASDPQPGVPDIDSVNVWPTLINSSIPSPREEVPLSYCKAGTDCDEGPAPAGSMNDAALIVGQYKIVTGGLIGVGHGNWARSTISVSLPLCLTHYLSASSFFMRHLSSLTPGYQGGMGFWQGPLFPNGSSPALNPGCPQGCLFDVLADPTEQNDIKAQQPDLFQNVSY